MAENEDAKMSLNPLPILAEVSAKVAPKRRDKRERDIFGNEYLGSKQVIHLNLDLDTLPVGLKLWLEMWDVLNEGHTNSAQIITEALREVSPLFWETKLDECSPLEWKLLNAMEDEDFRKSVEDVLGVDHR